MFTGAAPSLGFGGYYKRKWFSAPWSDKFSTIPIPDHFLSLYKMYPVALATFILGVFRGSKIYSCPPR
ncbi:UNVERIFIED_CONTAM: hypothetical protein FKN15_025625 [Acipenser sinensis]